MSEVIIQQQINQLDERLRLLASADVVTNGIWSIAVAAASEVDLLSWDFHNTGPATGQLYGFKIVTDTDVVDTGAGIAIFNIGHSDAIYLNIAGKSGNPAGNSPTGVGIDINKEVASSSERASSNSSQQGIQIFDWSTTDQGIGGPRGMIIQKLGSLNTDHILMTLRSNRNILQMIVKGADAGFDATKPAVSFNDESTGVAWWVIRAGGDQVFNKDGAGIQWITPGSKTAYIIASTNDLKLKSGGTGIRFVNQADTQTGLLMQDNCDLVMSIGGPATTATAGFPHIPAMAGTPTGAPTTYSGWVPMVYDSTNNILYVYSGGAWRAH